jgi:RND superfamily putative drug exporter
VDYVERFLYRIAHFSARFKWIVVAAWILIVVVVTTTCPKLIDVASSSNGAFLPCSEPSMQAEGLISPCGAAVHPTGDLVFETTSGAAPTTAQKQTIASQLAAVEKVPNVISVGAPIPSLSTPSTQVSIVTVNTAAQGDATNAVVAGIRNVASSNSAQGLNVYLTGTIGVSADNAASSAQSQNLTSLLSFIILFVILAIVYRSVLTPFLNLIPVFIAISVAESIVAEASTWGLPISSLVPALMGALMLGAGTDYGLFLIMRFREEQQNYDSTIEAISQSVSKVGEAVIYAALTVSAALFCLYFASFGMYKGLGPALAIAILVMLVSALTLIPALLAFSGSKTFWPSKKVPRVDSGWARIAEKCAKRPGITLSAGAGLLVVLALFCISLTITGFASSSAPSGYASTVGNEVLAKNFPASFTSPTSFVYSFDQPIWNEAQLTKLDAAETAISKSSLIASTAGPFEVTIPLDPNSTKLTTVKISPATLLEGYKLLGEPATLPSTPPSGLTTEQAALYQIYKYLGQYISSDGKRVQVNTTLTAGGPSSDAALADVPQLRTLSANTASIAQAPRYGVAGIAPILYDVKNISNQDLFLIFPIVMAVIGILLAMLLRSVIAPIFLLLTVILSFASTLGITVLVWMIWGGQGGLTFVLPFMLFVFLVALGEDYNILVMSRIREEWPLGGDRDSRTRAVVKAVGETGTTVTSAGIILTATFAVLIVTGTQDQIREIGFALAIGILLDTFIVRTLLVPSIVQLLGHFTWWPSNLSKKNIAPSTKTEVGIDA